MENNSPAKYYQQKQGSVTKKSSQRYQYLSKNKKKKATIWP